MKPNQLPLRGRALHFAGVCGLMLSSWACNAGASDAPSSDEFAWRCHRGPAWCGWRCPCRPCCKCTATLQRI